MNRDRQFGDHVRLYNQQGENMGVIVRAKRPVLVLGFVFFAIGILWSVDSPEPTEDLRVHEKQLFELEISQAPSLERSLQTDMLRRQVEDAIGLTVATVSVTMEYPPSGEVHAPWRDNKRPHVRVFIPRSWVVDQSERMGGREFVLTSIRNIVQDTVPGSNVEFTVMHDVPTAPVPAQTTEWYAKQIAMILGLVAVLLVGVVGDRTRRTQDCVVEDPADQPEITASRILQMDHLLARQSIDALHGTRKIEVLQAVVAMGEPNDAYPTVHVSQTKDSVKEQLNIN